MRYCLRLAIALMCALAGLLPAEAQGAKRVALVIGNADYRIGRLANPVNDAEAVAEAFKTQLKFDTVLLRKDLRLDAFRDALRELARAARGAELGVIFFAGHGIELGGRNFLIPVDAALASAQDIDLEAIALDTVLRQLDGVTKLRLVILDACRNNPFPAGTRGARGLARIEPDGGTLVAYAAKDGTTADDGIGRHSPFTAALLKRIVTPGLDVRRVFGYVSQDVKAATNLAQVPYLYGQLGGDQVHLVPAKEPDPAGQTGQTPGHTVPSSGPPGSAVEAVRICREVEKMSNPTLLRALADRHKGPAADCIAARIAELARIETAQAAAAAKKMADEDARTKANAERICGNLRAIADVAVLKAMADQHRGTPAETCIAARIDALQKQTLALATSTKHSPSPKAAPLTAAQERALKPRDTFKECDACPEMVVVPPGSFLMGSPGSEAGRYGDEGPQHYVTIARPFAVARFEATFAEWDACVTDGGCRHRPGDRGWGRGRRPVIDVAWGNIATEYLPWLSRKTGRTYRLLTEAEWEYVARAGSATRYHFGSSVQDLCAYGNSADLAAKEKYKGWAAASCHDGYVNTAPVGSFRPNAFGLFDVHGNVWEWVQDCWNGSHVGAPADGSARMTGACSRRVLRGGSWCNAPTLLRSATRYGGVSTLPCRDFGFRVARPL
jgi:formylglycine-generating enzyme required for sulfatase activity